MENFMALNEQEKAFWYQRFTLEGRMFYPDLLEPKASKNGGALRYGLMFACKMGSNPQEIAKIGAFLQQAKGQYHSNIPDQFWNNPVKRFDTYQRTDGRANHEFLRDCYFINLSTGLDMPPQVVNSARQPVMDKAEVYSGRNCVISLTFWLNNGGKDGTGKKGVGANINAVMLMNGGDKEGGSVAINVNEVFGNFAQDMGIKAPAYGAPAYGAQQPQQQGQAPAWPPTNNQSNNGQNNGGLI